MPSVRLIPDCPKASQGIQRILGVSRAKVLFPDASRDVNATRHGIRVLSSSSVHDHHRLCIAVVHRSKTHEDTAGGMAVMAYP